jgi:hypothetical protein
MALVIQNTKHINTICQIYSNGLLCKILDFNSKFGKYWDGPCKIEFIVDSNGLLCGILNIIYSGLKWIAVRNMK